MKILIMDDSADALAVAKILLARQDAAGSPPAEDLGGIGKEKG